MADLKDTPCKHDDCMNYIPVDVAKGICAHSNQLIVNDSETCPKFKPVQKCKTCSHYQTGEEEGLGLCVGLEDKGFWAYGEMSARNCPGWE